MSETGHPNRDWKCDYSSGTAPWDTGRVSAQLRRFLASGHIISAPGRALELGCGTGTNAIFLAEAGFEVTAVDFTAEALCLASRRARQAGVQVRWIEADVLHLADIIPAADPFDLIFDRGCFHGFAPCDRPGFVEQLRIVTRPGSVVFLLTGNSREPFKNGPPVVSEAEIRETFDSSFKIQALEEFRFDTTRKHSHPLGYACHMTRR